MAIHVRALGITRKALRRIDLRNKLGAMLSGIFVVGGIALVLTCWVIYSFNGSGTEFLAYVPASESSESQSAPTSVAPVYHARIPTPVAEVEPTVIVAEIVPPLDIVMEEVSPDEILDAGISLALAANPGESDIVDPVDGEGEGKDSEADNGGGLGTAVSDGSQLEGSFYDLKQREDRSYSGISGGDSSEYQVISILHRFLNNWSPQVLENYYRAKQRLYASHFFLPVARAHYGPIAYNCEKECRPSAWVAIYRGKVRAPKSGKFRFVGTGDDTLAVRFDGQTVLVAGYSIPTRRNGPRRIRNWREYERYLEQGNDEALKEYELIQLDGIPRWNHEIGGLTGGKSFEVEKGKVYPIEIMISEIPGGCFGLMLLIEDMTDKSVGGKAKPKYDLFRTNSAKPNEKRILKVLQKYGCDVRGGLQVPVYNADAPIWEVVP